MQHSILITPIQCYYHDPNGFKNHFTMLDILPKIFWYILRYSFNLGGTIIRYPILKILNPKITFNEIWDGPEHYHYNCAVGFIAYVILLYFRMR